MFDFQCSPFEFDCFGTRLAVCHQLTVRAHDKLCDNQMATIPLNFSFCDKPNHCYVLILRIEDILFHPAQRLIGQAVGWLYASPTPAFSFFANFCDTDFMHPCRHPPHLFGFRLRFYFSYALPSPNLHISVFQ